MKYEIKNKKLNTIYRKSNTKEKKLFNLGQKDSNLRMTGPKPVVLPLDDTPFYFFYNYFTKKNKK